MNENLTTNNDYDDTLKDFKVIESDTKSFLVGKPKYKLVSTYKEDGFDYESMESGTIIGDKVYFIIWCRRRTVSRLPNNNTKDNSFIEDNLI